MKQISTSMKKILLVALCLFSLASIAQENTEETTKSNIQTYTPSKLLKKGQWDIKWFNNFYTETEDTFTSGKQPRSNFYTSTFEIFTGVSENSRVNIGVVFNVKSTTESSLTSNEGWFSTLSLGNETGVSRSGLTSIAPSISFQPFKNVGNFSVRSSIIIPLVSNEKENGVFLDKKSWIWENKFFYDYTFESGKWQIFTELDTQLHFGESYSEDSNGTSTGGFANNSLGLPISAFLSYFPSSKFTIFGQTQQYFLIDLGNNFSQEYTQLGIGAKYQLTTALNIETSYTNFVRGTDTGLGQTFNVGLRALF